MFYKMKTVYFHIFITSTGVPRIKEIINVAKTIKSPSMEIYLKDEYAGDISGAKY